MTNARLSLNLSGGGIARIFCSIIANTLFFDTSYAIRDTKPIKAVSYRERVIEIRLPVIHRENALAPRFGNETETGNRCWYREKLAHRTARTSRTLHPARGESRGQKQVPLISLKSVVPRERHRFGDGGSVAARSAYCRRQTIQRDKNVKLMLFCSHCLRSCTTFVARLDEPLLLAPNYILLFRFAFSPSPPRAPLSLSLSTSHRPSPPFSLSFAPPYVPPENNRSLFLPPRNLSFRQ